jgi:hypothetical protein
VQRISASELRYRTDRYYSPYPLPNEDSNTNTHVHETPTNPRKRQRTSASPAVVAVEGSKLGAGRSVPAAAPGSNLRKATDMFAKGVEGSRGRLWVCDVCDEWRPLGFTNITQLCFKYMKERAAWERHTVCLLTRWSLTTAERLHSVAAARTESVSERELHYLGD